MYVLACILTYGDRGRDICCDLAGSQESAPELGVGYELEYQRAAGCRPLMRLGKLNFESRSGFINGCNHFVKEGVAVRRRGDIWNRRGTIIDVIVDDGGATET